MNESPYIRETAFDFFEQQTKQVEPNEQFHSKECSRGGPFPLYYIRDIEWKKFFTISRVPGLLYFTDIDFRLSTASRLVQSVVQRTIDTPKTSKDGYIK